jgi:hypothetical protein
LIGYDAAPNFSGAALFSQLHGLEPDLATPVIALTRVAKAPSGVRVKRADLAAMWRKSSPSCFQSG